MCCRLHGKVSNTSTKDERGNVNKFELLSFTKDEPRNCNKLCFKGPKWYEKNLKDKFVTIK